MVVMQFWLFAAAFSSSVTGGLLGMASGIFVVPILIVAFGMSIHEAAGIGLVSVVACSCSSAAPFLKSRLANVRLAVVLESATTSGAFIGVLTTGIISSNALYALFAAVLAVSSWQLLMRRHEMHLVAVDPSGWSTKLNLHSSYIDPSSGELVGYVVGSLPWGLILMFFAGLLSSLLGIGSGVLKVPAMDSALKLPLKVSSGTSNFMIGVTAAAGASAYYFKGEIDPMLAGPVALGSVAGAALGAKLLIRLPTSKLRLAFSLILLLVAGQMLFSAFGHDPL